MSKEGKKGGALKVMILVVLLIVFLYAALNYAVPAFEDVDLTAVEGSADWMAGKEDDYPITYYSSPGTHDSATQYVQLAFFSKCQALSIKQQLEAGFRYLDIRLGESDSGLKLMHGFTNCKEGPWPWSGTLYLDKVLEDCYAFLDEHPTELILFCVKHEHGDMDDDAFLAELKKVIDKTPDRWYTEDRIPTLGEARGKLVLLRRFGSEGPGLYFIWTDQNKNAPGSAEFPNVPHFNLTVQDWYELETEEKWQKFNDVMHYEQPAADGTVTLNFLSTMGSAKFGHPFKYAKELNERFLELERGEYFGWIVVDFGTPKLAEHIRVP